MNFCHGGVPVSGHAPAPAAGQAHPPVRAGTTRAGDRGRRPGAVGVQASRLRAGVTFTASKVYTATALQTQQLLGDCAFYLRYFSDFV